MINSLECYRMETIVLTDGPTGSAPTDRYNYV